MTSSLDRFEPLRLPPAERSWKETLWVIVGILLFGGMLVACAVYTAPPLLSDWQVRDTARPVPAARITDGKCSTKIIIHICDMTLNLGTPAGTVTRRVNTVFTGVHFGDYKVGVMADPARPELVTTDLALDRLINRTITLAALMAMLLAFSILPIVAVVRNRRAASEAR